MMDEPGTDIIPAEPGDESPGALSIVFDAVGAYFGKIPSVITKNVARSFSHLMKIPNAYIDGKAGDIKATFEARAAVTKATGKALAKSVEIDHSLAAIATATHASKILRQQVNAAGVLKEAVKELEKNPPDPSKPVEEIAEDWLNAFEQEAVNMSSEHMQTLFGKILAGEIRKPTSFSIRTVKLMSQIDNRAAQLFRKLCSLACTLRIGPMITDSRVITVKGNASSNGLQEYGLSFADLNILFEYGLIISDYNSYMMYVAAIVRDNRVGMPFTYLGKAYGLVPKAPMAMEQMIAFNVHGVQLSRAGIELLDIVETKPDEKYTEALMAFFDSHGYAVGDVAMPPL